MTRAIEEQLAAAGVDAADVPGRAALLGQAIEHHYTRLGVEPERAWFSPGRIEVIGKHTDYAGGRSLVCAAPRGFAIVSSPRPDGRVRVLDARWHDRVVIDPTDHTRRFNGWTNYIAVVARRLARNFPGASLGADISLASDLPRAAGVSSSSALVVGLASALIEAGGLTQRPEWHANIRSPLDLSGYLGATENGLTFGTLAGTSGVGTHGGSEDHTAILASQPGCLSAYAYVPVRHLEDVPMPADWRFVVMSSGVHADKAGAVRERYNRASLATRALLDLWNVRMSRRDPSLAAALAHGEGAVTQLRDLLEPGFAGFTGADLERRLNHFIAEDARVLPAVQAFRAADMAAMDALSSGTQADARDLLGNQIPETDRLAELARACGAFGASSFGAGFGGSVWALVQAADADRFALAWVQAYRAEFPTMTRVEWFVTRPAPGAITLRLSE